MNITLQTLTPLWTGGVDAGQSDRIHETGIIGSLRWWYEAILRGLGGNVCDPTTQSCQYANEMNHRLCDACRIFGATGWKRRFRLDVQDSTTPDSAVTAQIRAQRSYQDGNGKTRTPTWYFPNKPRSGQLAIRIQSLDKNFQPEVIAGLIQFAADWSAIGARAQMGFGVITPVNGRIETQKLYDHLIAVVGSHRHPNLPSLQNIFLAQVKPKDSSPSFTEQTTFNLKYDLRRLFANDQGLRHFIMGTVKDVRIAAKVKISRPYDGGLMRVWGWIPEEANVYTSNWNREKVIAAIHQHLQANYSLQVWRELNSTRDASLPNCRDAKAFLRDLLFLKEDEDAV